MKVINNEMMDLEIIANKIPKSAWSSRCCYSCTKPFAINDKKIKWRMKIPGAYYALWKIQCGACAVNTMSMWTRELNEILRKNIIEVNAVGN